MASITGETSPLLPTQSAPSPGRPKAPRNVTFNANPVTRTIEAEPQPPRPRSAHHHGSAAGSSSLSPGGGGPMLTALNSKLRRRNSHSAVAGALPSLPAPKIGPQRSTKNAQKLKILPALDPGEAEPDEESGRDVYSQYTRIKDPTARRDAARLGKADRARLPRVTAYCTANKYDMEALQRFLKGRGKSRGANPKLIDECIYTPYGYAKPAEGGQQQQQSQQQQQQQQQGQAEHPSHLQVSQSFPQERRHSAGDVMEGHREELADLRNDGHGSGNGFSVDNGDGRQEMMDRHMEYENIVMDSPTDFDIQVHTPEVFLFEYGVVVIWGMSAKQEERFRKELAKFEIETLAEPDVETENFNFYYTKDYQPRIYNDFITLRDRHNYMTKLAISHALAQSVKTSLFEELIASTIDTCKDIPTQIAMTGKISLSRSQINMQIGELFILRINIHLNGSVLDTPELFWVEPALEPVYQAVRSYLEMDQRVGLLTERLDVIADLLAVLKDQLSHGHGEKLEWIVIVLIAAEILVAIINIVVDLYAGV